MAKILIVEDMRTQAQLLEHHLAALGHESQWAGNGQEALEYLSRERPDIIISDVQMPVMNGLELCKEIKANPALRFIPVILLTAADEATDVLRGINAHADVYLTKPYEQALLGEIILTTIAANGAEDEAAYQDSEPIEVELNGEKHTITASRKHMAKLFLSAYQSSSIQNSLLIEKETKLTETNNKLSRSIEQLSASEERFRGLVQTLPDIVYKIDRDGCFTFVNDSIHRLGYHQTDLLGRHFSEIIFDEDVEHVSADSVIPKIRETRKNAETDDVPTTPHPKLFDERRTTDRMTIGLELRLKTKSGEFAGHAELKALGEQLLYVEVNSIGMYGENPNSDRQYVGSVGVIRDISERIATQQAMKLAKEAADTANKAKSEFLSSMSHELRTPLNAILGFSQLLDDPDNPLNGEQISSVGHILDGGEHLLNLINEVLDLAKIESGNISISIERIEPVKAVSQCILMANALAEKRNITVINNVLGDQIPWLYADLVRFKQVLINLLSNAVKYNENGGQVTLDWADTGEGMVRLTVTDNGYGIPEERHDELFRPFQRLGKEASDIEGTGIGLTISRELVERMKGHIGFKSQPDEGSEFWIEFPIASTQHDVTLVGDSKGDIEEVLEDGETTFKDTKILIYIEDNPANLQLMGRVVLNIPNCRLLSSSNAEDGLKLIDEKKPDLILMDINLPGMSGFDAMKILQGQDSTRNIPVIAITAAAMAESVAEGRALGFTEYLTKPFNVANVAKVIIKTLRATEN
ncbi:MAG: response regulator [Rhodospirillales bacterium]|nr:response regulator [Rhodospirillales bacterium]